MKFLANYSCLLTLIALPLAVSSSAVLAHPVAANPASNRLEQPANKSDDAFYSTARSQIEGSLGTVGPDYYAVYRIVERIARANGLDQTPWRVRVTDELNINAYASDVNMLTFEAGILEQISGDTAALACVVGHEMAHHTKNHIPSMVAARVRIEGLQEEALLQARSEVESAQQQGNILGGIFGAVTGGVFNATGANSSIGGILAGNVVSSTLQGLNAEQTQQATARAEELYNERVEALDAEYSTQLRSQESEADEVGYGYMVAAGFSPDGCVRVMNVLDRIETSRLPSLSHPNPQDRIRAINTLNIAAANQSLVQVGQANLRQSAKPLGYGVGRDGASLRIESRFGAQDIDSTFPQ